MKVTATKSHELQAAHRLVGHEGQCRRIHGHSYRFEITIESDSYDFQLNPLGMVADFSDISKTVCKWLDDNWDHRLLLWSGDPLLNTTFVEALKECELDDSIQLVPFNPTAENMAAYLIETICPQLLKDIPVSVVKVKVYETTKCCAEVSNGGRCVSHK